MGTLAARLFLDLIGKEVLSRLANVVTEIL